YSGDPNVTAIRNIRAKYYEYTAGESFYRLAGAIHNDYSARVVHDVDKFYKFAENAGDIYHTLVSLMGHNIAHEAAGHALGLVHTNKLDPTDIMSQGLDFNNSRIYSMTAPAVPMALGLDW